MTMMFLLLFFVASDDVDVAIDEFAHEVIAGVHDDEHNEYMSDEPIVVKSVQPTFSKLINRNQDIEDQIKSSRSLLTPVPEPKLRIKTEGRRLIETNNMSILKYKHMQHKQERIPLYDQEIEEDNTLTETLDETRKWFTPAFTISEIHPNHTHHFGGEMIAMKVTPAIEGNCICRFDQIVVRGKVNASGWVICRVPGHEPGLIGVWYSRDGRRFHGPIPFTYDHPSGLETLLLMGPTILVGVAIGCVVIWFLLWITKP